MRSAVFAICLLLGFATASASAAPAGELTAQEPGSRKRGRIVEPPYGREGDPRKVKRVIAIDMSDTMRFFPSELKVKRGETVRFELRNSGHEPHEMVIGTMDELKRRAAHLKHKHDAHVSPFRHVGYAAPGASTKIVWQFGRAGEFYYACLVPGHFDAGMIGTVVVR